MKHVSLIVAATVLAPGAPAVAAEAASAVAPATMPAYSTSETDIGTLLDNPATRAVLEKHMASMVSNPRFEQARAMTLKQVQSAAPQILTDELLAKVDADLAKIPAK
jgi:para-nitrobenzyl esterase